MNIVLEEGRFASANQRDELFYTVFTPEEPPRGAVLIHHGMSGRSASYEGLCRFLCEQGYTVYAYDCAGHGKSVKEGEPFGSFAVEGGDVVLVKDLAACVGLIRKRYRHLPLFLLGHSLGSFVIRAYVAANDAPVDGVILSGTCQDFHLSRWNERSLRSLAKKGDADAIVKKMFAPMEKEFAGEPGSWLTTDPEAFFVPDPLSGHKLTAVSYYDMFRLMAYISSDDWLGNLPRHLPMLFLSGKRDPVGGEGTGIEALCERLRESDISDVTCILYEGEKHEIINTPRVAPLVREDILRWLTDKTEAAVELRRQCF